MRFCRDKKTPVFITGKDTLTTEDVSRLLFESETFNSKYQKNEDYYHNKHKILDRTYEDDSKPNSKVCVGYPNYICQIRNGYFSSSPLSLDSENKDYLEEVSKVLEENDFKKVFSELDNISSIYGHAFLCMYLDEEGIIRLVPQSPKDWIYVRSNDLLQTPKFAIRYYKYFDDVLNEACYDIELYTKDEIINYEGTATSLEEVGRRPHYFGALPVIEFSENKTRQGAFENVIDLIDGYESVLNDNINSISYFSDCYLVIENAECDEEDIEAMKRNRVIVLPENSHASFLMKNINETFVKNALQDIREAIFVVACCPLLSDSSFSSNSSGVSISYKLFSMEKSIQNKENIFRKSFNDMFAMIRTILNLKGAKFTTEDRILMTYTRSNPVKDLTSIADAVSKLRGTVSNASLLSQLDFVGDVQLEKQRLAEERQEEMDFQLKYMDVLGQDLNHDIEEPQDDEDNNNYKGE